MAISYKVENVPISAVRDRAMFNTFSNNQSYVIKDIGSELEVLSSAQSFIVQLGTGEAVICGGSMLSEGDENRITLGENESGYLVIRIDLSQTGTNICRFMSVPSLVQGNINNGADLIYDLPLYVYATDSNGVQNLNDIRSIKNSASINYVAGTGIDISNNVISSDLLGAIDVSNILLNWRTGNFSTYTATEDCWFCKMHDYDGGAGGAWKIDNEQIIQGKTSFITPLKQGQTLTQTGSTSVMWINVYGMLR